MSGKNRVRDWQGLDDVQFRQQVASDLDSVDNALADHKRAADLRSTATEKRLEKFLWIAVGAVISTATGVLMFALNLGVGAT